MNKRLFIIHIIFSITKLCSSQLSTNTTAHITTEVVLLNNNSINDIITAPSINNNSLFSRQNTEMVAEDCLLVSRGTYVCPNPLALHKLSLEVRIILTCSVQLMSWLFYKIIYVVCLWESGYFDTDIKTNNINL